MSPDVRKRKAHKKSRRGCRNCKLRRVKCDETRPQCTKCVTFGVSCNYDLKTGDLVPNTGVNSLEPLQWELVEFFQERKEPLLMTAAPFLHHIISDNQASLQLDRECLARLDRFQSRTSLSIGPPRDTHHTYQKATIKLACEHPYLMHVVQTLTATHDRHLSQLHHPRRTPAEVIHWDKALSLFNQKLAKTIDPADRDGIWATAALLGVIAFAFTSATTPQESWPLRPARSTDLDWLKMCRGKNVIWKLTDPLRPDSIFSDMKQFYDRDYFLNSAPEIGIEGVPFQFADLCELNEFSTAESNSYFTPVHGLAVLLRMQCNRYTIAKFLSFLGHMEIGFKVLIEAKDPRALVLVANWYSRILGSVWWVEKRALLEGQGICLYLAREYPLDSKIQELLEGPRKVFEQRIGAV